MGNCQNYDPFLGPYYNTGPNTGPNLGDPKRDHNFDNPSNEKSSHVFFWGCSTLTNLVFCWIVNKKCFPAVTHFSKAFWCLSPVR